MNSSHAFTIRQSALDDILKEAERTGSQECLGLLATDGLGVAATDACLLPARASRSHAVAEPLVLRHAIDLLNTKGLLPSGIWHNHGNFQVFHSVTDDDTMLRLAPALAEFHYHLPQKRCGAPTVTDCDQAILPLCDGRLLQLTLVGPAMPGTDGRERMTWSRVGVTYGERVTQPCVVQEANLVKLTAGRVCLAPGVPEQAAVLSEVVDHSPVHRARLYSLVVNRRGDQYVEVVTVNDFEGELHVDRRPCEMTVVGDHGDEVGGVRMLDGR